MTIGMAKDGIYLPDGSFKSRDEIVSEGFARGEIIQRTPLNEPHNFDRWQEIASRRRDERMESEGLPSEIEIEIPTDRPIVVSLMGDQHIGGMYHDYELMGHHTSFVREHPLAYVALLGDLFEGMFFGAGQLKQILNYDEQAAYTRAMIEAMNGKVLFATIGDHDAWLEKMGPSFYDTFIRDYRAHVLRGSSLVHLKVGDVTYDVITAHQLPGHSMYNKVHPQTRESKFGTQGADIYVSGHTHQKGIAQQHINDTRGGRVQTYISVGPYKYSDEYAQKKGFHQQRELERGAVFVKLDPHTKRVTPYWTVEQAADGLARHL